jgi:hypothetical protein
MKAASISSSVAVAVIGVIATRVAQWRGSKTAHVNALAPFNRHAAAAQVDLLEETTGELPRGVSAPIAVVSDHGPCFPGAAFAEAFTGCHPLLPNVHIRVKPAQSNGGLGGRVACRTDTFVAAKLWIDNAR